MSKLMSTTALPLLIAGAVTAGVPALAAPTTSALLGGIVINEILIDPNGASNFDTDGDGTAETEDEFVELHNQSSGAINVGGLQLWDQGRDHWFTFPSYNVGPGDFAYVGVNAAGGSVAANGFDAGLSGGVLNNSGDNVVLYDPSGDQYVQAVYNGNAPLNPTDPADGFDGFSATASLVGSVEDFGSDSDGISLTRAPAGDTNVVQHDTVSGDNASPGAEAGMAPPPPTGTALTIMEIQGAGHTSAEVGNTVQTSGVVTVLADNGFYMQDPTGDGNTATSDGIFVFTGSAPTVNVGEGVTVDGTVDEFFGETQIDTITNIAVASVGNVIQPIDISTDGMTADRVQPDRVVDDAGSAVFDEANEGRDFYESLEGMLVRVPNARAVSDEDTRPSHGEFYVVSEDGDPAQFNSRGGITISGDPSADNPIGADLNPERIQIDPEAFADLRPGDGAGNTLPPEMGDRVANDGQGGIVGAMHFSFDDYSIEPNSQVVTTDIAYADETTSLTGGPNQLTTATYNLFNLDPTDPQSKFDALAGHIVNNLAHPDIIGLQEIQDNNGPAGSGGAQADVTLQRLIDAIDQNLDLADDGMDNDSASSGYVFIDNRFITDGANGGEPGGNIRTAFLYNQDRVDLVAGSEFSIDKNGNQVFDPAGIGDTQTDPASPFFDTRLPLGATFVFNGEQVTIINNHFPSKSGSDPLFASNQPPVNGQVELREDIAALINGLVDSLLATDPNDNLVVMGDLNEFQFFSPLGVLEGSLDPNDPGIATPGDQVLYNLADLIMDQSDIFTFEFEGNSQALDHILVSDALDLFGLPEVDYVHLNAGELFETLASDHDPIVARFTIGTVTAASEPGVLVLLASGLPLGLALLRLRSGAGPRTRDRLDDQA